MEVFRETGRYRDVNKKNMKRILAILSITLCICACEKADQGHWLSGFWYGEYETSMIGLQFSSDGAECTVSRAKTDGSCSMNRSTYHVYVQEQFKTFILMKGTGTSSEQDYTGRLSDGKITLSWTDEAGRVVELKKMLLE